MADDKKFRWHLTTSNHWATNQTFRGYTGAIVYVAGTGYTLTITGSGAPGAGAFTTLKLAKNSFRKFLHTKP